MPRKSTAGTQRSWRWMEDEFPFSWVIFLGSMTSFRGVYVYVYIYIYVCMYVYMYLSLSRSKMP